MRLKNLTLLAVLSLLTPALLQATAYNEATIDKLNGTIMDQPADGSTPYALQTNSTVTKGDVLTCYDRSWVILKTHSGDRIGLCGNTCMVIDEYYFEGPDRQIRLILKNGTLLLKTGGRGSAQSFFEINAGSVVASINDVHAILTYDPSDESFTAQYMVGKLTVIDKDHEEKFKANNTENTWIAGKMTKTDPDPVDELDSTNFNRFFDDQDLLAAAGNNILLSDNPVISEMRADGVWGSKIQQASQVYHYGVSAYNAGRFHEAEDFWKEALDIEPDYNKARSSLQKLAEDHPELKMDESDWKFESQEPEATVTSH